MGNAVLESFQTQRDNEVARMGSILEQVQDRDLSDAEKGILEAASSRIAALDAQIEPLEAYDRLVGAHSRSLESLPRIVPAEPRRADGGERSPEYRSAGAFIVDLIRARGMMSQGQPDAQAAARIAQTRAIADQTTSDTPGLLPTPVVGQVVNLIDAQRPLVSSLGGAHPLGGIPGTTFTRPKIVTHTTVGPQSAQKALLPSQKMSISSVTFTKSTYGGTVDISRQDIDWTSPSAWDILVKDLADVYAVQTETAVATAFTAAAASTPVVVATNDLKGWTTALYTAAMHSYQAGGRMPDRIWCSLNVWAALGSLVDVARVQLPTNGNSDTAAGQSSLATFAGDVLGLPRIVVPTLAPGTCIVGPSSLYEVYEEVIGLLSVIEPSILGVQVAYGGYVSWGTLAGAAFVPLTAPAGIPTMMDDGEIEALNAADNEPEAQNHSSKSKS
jgi:HK97 family phage major capsid protein